MEALARRVRSWEAGHRAPRYMVVGIDGNAGLLARQAGITGDHIFDAGEQRLPKRLQAAAILRWAAEHGLRAANTFASPDSESSQRWT